MVAKSFQSLRQIGEPYTKNGRQYVKIEKKSGGEREVRWYTEAEYIKLYPNEKVEVMPKVHSFFVPSGYIYVVKDWSAPQVLKYIIEHRPVFRQHGYFGWFVASYEQVPTDLPPGLDLVKVDWELGKEREKYLEFKRANDLMSFYENW